MINSRGSFLGSIPPVTKNLLIINVIMWLATSIFQQRGIDLENILGLHYWGASGFNPAQLFTYMFMHAGFAHIFFNMFSLWMFGRILEQVLGGKRFLFYYISCGLGAAITQEAVWTFTWENMLAFQNAAGEVTLRGSEALQYAIQTNQLNPFLNSFITVGASGAVFGILLAFGMIFPNMPLYFMFIPVPVKAKWMVLGYGALELVFGITGAVSAVAHFAHLGGMIFGFIIIYYWKKKGVIGGGTFS